MCRAWLPPMPQFLLFGYISVVYIQKSVGRLVISLGGQSTAIYIETRKIPARLGNHPYGSEAT